MAINLRKWDESVPHHVGSPTYDVPAFLRGRTTLEPLEIRTVGSVRGRTLLHLQCHFGLDTLSWARRGAIVTGVDFSPKAIRAARTLARAAGLSATFVRANVYDLDRFRLGTFDRVYTGKGALCWLPDLRPWGQLIAQHLNPGGRFFVLDDHPFADLFPNERHVTRLELKYPYHGGTPQRDVSDGTYATSVKMRYRVSYGWVHPISTVLGALLDAGLIVRSVREYPYSYWHKFPFMHRTRDGYWRLDAGDGAIPMMWSVVAEKPTGAAPRVPRGRRLEP